MPSPARAQGSNAARSRLASEARLEETGGAGMEGWKGRKEYRQIIQDEQPNTGRNQTRAECIKWSRMCLYTILLGQPISP